MIDIASSLLASVTGGFEDGVGLQPGATEGTRNPIIHPRGRKVWLRPGATGDSRDPLGPVVPQQRLQPGAVPPVGAD